VQVADWEFATLSNEERITDVPYAAVSRLRRTVQQQVDDGWKRKGQNAEYYHPTVVKVTKCLADHHIPSRLLVATDPLFVMIEPFF